MSDADRRNGWTAERYDGTTQIAARAMRMDGGGLPVEEIRMENRTRVIDAEIRAVAGRLLGLTTRE